MATKKTIIISGTITLLIVALIFSVFAASTNYKVYDPGNRTAYIFDAGNNLLAKITLLSPNNVVVPRGYQKVAEFRLENMQSTTNIFKQIDFFDNKNGFTTTIRTYDFRIKEMLPISVDDYGDINISLGKYSTTSLVTTANASTINYVDSKGIVLCKQDQTTSKLSGCDYITSDKSVWKLDSGIVGSHIELLPQWSQFDKLKNKTLISSGIYDVAIFTDVQKGDFVEWVPTFFDVQIDEWASWTESFNSGLVAYYTFNDTTSVVDSTGNGNTGTNNGAVNGSGKLGSSYNFTGANYVVLPNMTSQFTTSASINVWVRMPDASNPYVWDMGNSSGGGDGFNVSVPATFSEVFRDDRLTLSNAQINVNDWHMVTIVQTPGANGWGYWVDAKNIYNATGESIVNIPDGGKSYQLGREWEGGWYYLTGQLDEIGIWNRTLNQSEITDLYNGGNGISYTPAASDSILPIIILIAPDPTQNSTSASNTFSARVSDNVALSFVILYGDFGGSWSINSTNTSALNNTNYNFTISLTDGTYTWAYFTNDTANNKVFSANRTLIIDTTKPTMTLLSPVDASISSSAIKVIGANIYDRIGVSWARIYGNFTGTWLINQTNASIINASDYNVTLIDLSDGTYLWAFWSNDTLGNSGFSTNRTFTIDTLSPSASINIENGRDFGIPTFINNLSVGFNYVITELHPNYANYSMFYPNDTNVIYNVSANFTWDFTAVLDSYGNYRFLIFSNDSVGNQEWKTINFKLNKVAGQEGGGGGMLQIINETSETTNSNPKTESSLNSIREFFTKYWWGVLAALILVGFASSRNQVVIHKRG